MSRGEPTPAQRRDAAYGGITAALAKAAAEYKTANAERGRGADPIRTQTLAQLETDVAEMLRDASWTDASKQGGLLSYLQDAVAAGVAPIGVLPSLGNVVKNHFPLPPRKEGEERPADPYSVVRWGALKRYDSTLRALRAAQKVGVDFRSGFRNGVRFLVTQAMPATIRELPPESFQERATLQSELDSLIASFPSEWFEERKPRSETTEARSAPRLTAPLGVSEGFETARKAVEEAS